jgi:hypothetical protein
VGYDLSAHAYDVDAALMSLELHERGIHALCPGTGGVEVTQDRCAAAYAASKLSDSGS